MFEYLPYIEHNHIERWTCKCGMNRICDLCGCGAGAIPCDCDRRDPKSFYYDPKFARVLCSWCGLSIPPGETYDPEYPKCDGCKNWSDEDDLMEEEDMDVKESYHRIERKNGLVTKFVCGDKAITTDLDMFPADLNYCPYCGDCLKNFQFDWTVITVPVPLFPDPLDEFPLMLGWFH